MTSEGMYTLQEARALLVAEQCQADGHVWDVVNVRTLADPAGTPSAVVCANCSASHAVVQPVPEGEA